VRKQSKGSSSDEKKGGGQERERERERERESKEWRENFLCIYVEGVEMMISKIKANNS
jgi:hypothetical protein